MADGRQTTVSDTPPFSVAPSGFIPATRDAETRARAPRVSRFLLPFILGTFSAGLVATVLAIALERNTDLVALILVLVLVAAAERFPIPLYGDGRLSIGFTGVVFAALALGMTGTAVVTATIVVSGFIFAERSPRKLAFNFGQHAVAGFLAAGAVTLSGFDLGVARGVPAVISGGLAGLLVFVVTSGSVSTAIALSSRRSFIQVHRANFAWMIPHYVGLGLVAGGVAHIYAAVGVLGLIVFLVPVGLTFLAMRQLVDKTRTTVDELETSHRRLKSAHNEMKALLEAVPDAMLRLDKDLVVVDFHVLSGHDQDIRQSPVGRRLSQVIPVDAADGLIRAMSRDRPSGTVLVAEYQVGRGAESAYFEARVSTVDEQDHLVMLRDITERRRAEEAQRLSEELRRSVTQNAPVVLFATDDEGRLSLVEGEGLTGTGRSAAMLIGQPVWMLFGNESSQRRHLDRALAGEGFSTILRSGDSEFDVHYAPYHDDQGAVVGSVGVALDITERRRVEAAMMAAQKLESLGVLAGGIAHDFNNLLVGILGSAGIALSELPEDSPARDTIRQIEVAGRRAADLARQMLAYSGKGRINVQPLDMNELVEETSALLHASISKRIRLVFNMDANLPLVEADATQIRQVVMNLVVNASDAIGDNQGTIKVTTGSFHAGEPFRDEMFSSAYLEPGTYVVLKVQDSGHGMDTETLARIFDPFFTTKFTGRGLGLAAVQGIIKGHRGAIRVESEPGDGTTFRVVLPAAAAGAILAPPTPEIPSDSRASGTVLIVDDDATVTEVTARALRMNGFDVICAGDGRSGVEQFTAYRSEIACVLLDMTMPGMSGEEAFARMKRLDADVPVVLMSGYAEEDATARFSGAGLAGFIQKPYELGTLLQTVRAVIERWVAA